MIPYDRVAWFRLLVSAHGTLARGVFAKVVGFGAIAVIIWAVDRLIAIPLRLPVGFHEVAGIVIGLILAFRTNTGYARFWEGRTLWGGIVNASRNLARIVVRHGGLDEGEAREFNAWIVAFAHATRCRLRGLEEVKEAEKLLPPDDYQRLRAAPHPALFCAEELSRRIADLSTRQALDPIMAGVAERQLAALVNCLGGCERIARTPTPLAYVLLMQRAAVLYLGSLPMGLLSRLDWLTPVVTMAVAYLVLMIETIGNELDDPFGNDPSDIPLDRICATIAFDLLGEGKRPALTPQRGVGAVER
jgi:putative membrane protein